MVRNWGTDSVAVVGTTIGKCLENDDWQGLGNADL